MTPAQKLELVADFLQGLLATAPEQGRHFLHGALVGLELARAQIPVAMLPAPAPIQAPQTPPPVAGAATSGATECGTDGQSQPAGDSDGAQRVEAPPAATAHRQQLALARAAQKATKTPEPKTQKQQAWTDARRAQQREKALASAKTRGATSPWTAERDSKLREMWPQPMAMILPQLFEALQAMPGGTIPSANSCWRRAVTLGLNSSRYLAAELEGEPRPQDQAPPATPAVKAPAPAPPKIAKSPPRAMAAPVPQVPPSAEELTPEQQAEIADAAVVARYARARKMLERGTEPSVVQMHTKVPMRECHRLLGELRREGLVTA